MRNVPVLFSTLLTSAPAECHSRQEPFVELSFLFTKKAPDPFFSSTEGLALDSLLWLVLQQVARHAEEGASGGIRRAIGRGDHHFSQQPDVGDAHQASPVN
jgi:hypothetical protein